MPKPTILIFSAEAYLKYGLMDKALAIIGPEYAKCNWNNSNNLQAYGSFWTEQGLQINEALAALERATELTPRDAFAWMALGEACTKKQEFSRAVQAAEKGVKLADGDIKDRAKGRLEAIKAEAAKKKE